MVTAMYVKSAEKESGCGMRKVISSCDRCKQPFKTSLLDGWGFFSKGIRRINKFDFYCMSSGRMFWQVDLCANCTREFVTFLRNGKGDDE